MKCKHCGEPIYQGKYWWNREWMHEGGRLWCTTNGVYSNTKAQP